MANVDLFSSAEGKLNPSTISEIVTYTDPQNKNTNVKDILDIIFKLLYIGDWGSYTSLTEPFTAELGSGYSNLFDLAKTVKSFLNDSDSADSTINKWKEIEKFLEGISDTQSLEGLLSDLQTTITSAYEEYVKNQLSGVEGSVNDNIADLQTKVATAQSAADAAQSTADNLASQLSQLQSTVNSLQSTINDLDSLYLKLTGGTLTGVLNVGSTKVNTGSTGITLPSGVTIY